MPENEELKCSKCSAALDTEGAPRWCKACRSRYNSEYRALKASQAETRGWLAGVAAMRQYLADQWGKYGPVQQFDGPTIARVIREAPGPVLPE